MGIRVVEKSETPIIQNDKKTPEELAKEKIINEIKKKADSDEAFLSMQETIKKLLMDGKHFTEMPKEEFDVFEENVVKMLGTTKDDVRGLSYNERVVNNSNLYVSLRSDVPNNEITKIDLKTGIVSKEKQQVTPMW